MSRKIPEDNDESKAKGVTARRGLQEAGDRVARRGTRTAEKARFPGTSWHNTAKSGEPGDGVLGYMSHLCSDNSRSYPGRAAPCPGKGRATASDGGEEESSLSAEQQSAEGIGAQCPYGTE